MCCMPAFSVNFSHSYGSMLTCLFFFSFPSCWTRRIHLSLLLHFQTHANKQMDLCADGTFRGGKGEGAPRVSAKVGELSFHWISRKTLAILVRLEYGSSVCVGLFHSPSLQGFMTFILLVRLHFIVLHLFYLQLNVLKKAAVIAHAIISVCLKN